MMNNKNFLTIFLFLLIVVFSSCSMSIEKQIVIYEQASEKVKSGDPGGALKMIETRIPNSDRKFVYYFYHGLYTRAQNYIKYTALALEDFLRAYDIKPDDYDINLEIGASYVFLEEYDKAIPYLEKALERFELGKRVIIESPPPYQFLAEAYLRAERFEEALEMNTRGIESNADPDDQWSYFIRGVILSQDGDVDSLTENYLIARKIIGEINLDDLEIRRDYGLRLIEMGYTAMANDLYMEWLRENDKYYFCYAEMGYILMLEGDWDKSFELLKTAESINNVDATLLQYLSFYYYFNGDLIRACNYEALARLQKTASDSIARYNSADTFLENYKTNWQFQRLLAIHTLILQ